MFEPLFQYDKLTDPTEDLRLLTFVPHNDEDVVACNLIAHTRRSAPTYVAVSYEWGFGPAEHTIIVNGGVYLVRANLWYCLKQLRIHQWCAYYWVDVLCINQVDHEERKAQVSMMGSVYSRATLVAAWTGVAPPDVKDHGLSAISFLDRDSHIWEVLYHRNLRKCKTMSLAVARFCNRSYWRRLWIVQEILLAQDIKIMCGDQVLDCDQLRAFFKFLEARNRAVSEEFGRDTAGMFEKQYVNVRDNHNEQEQPHRSVLSSDAARLLMSDVKPRQDNWEVQGISVPKFVKLLDHHHSSTSCFDIRDKIYGLLALDPQMADFVPDYMLSTWDLYVRLLIYMQARHPQLPALLVSHVLQTTLCLQSHDEHVYTAIRSVLGRPATTSPVFQDLVRRVGSVQRVGASVPKSEFSPGVIEDIRISLGLHWTDRQRSFSGRDFFESQHFMVATLAIREDMFVSSAFESPPGRSSVVRHNTMLSEFTSVYGPPDAASQHQRSGNRYFLTKDCIVGFGCGNVATGDIICQAFGRAAPMFLVRHSSEHGESYRLIGRCYAWLMVDEFERQAAKEGSNIDLIHLEEGAVPSTYWAPQVTHLQPVMLDRQSVNNAFRLYLDLEALVGASALGWYWRAQSGEDNGNVEDIDDEEAAQTSVSGRLDRLKILVDGAHPRTE